MKRLIMPAVTLVLLVLCIAMFFNIQAMQRRLDALEMQQAQPADTIIQEPEPDELVLPTEEELDGMQAEISTIEAVRAYFDQRYPKIWMSAHLSDGQSDNFWLASGSDVMQRFESDSVGRGCIANAATWLLSDDMEIYTVLGFRSFEGSGNPMWAMNCIKSGDGYEIIDPVLGLRGDEGSRYGALLPEAKVASLEEYVELISSDAAIMAELDSLWLFPGGGQIDFTENAQGIATVTSNHGQLLYVNEDKVAAVAEAAAQLKARIKPENIGNYAISNMLGGVTLSAEQAYALVDAEPETVREQVKTAGDLLMYMLAAQTGDNGGCYCDWWDGYTWHTNFTAKEVMEKRLGNCGSCANLANYLLAGDYEEIGFINHAYYFGEGGGHVYNYIIYEGRCYIVDFSLYIFSNYEDHDIPVFESLEAYDGDAANALYGGVSLVIGYTSPGRHLPNIFGEETGEPYYYVPEGAEYTVLYEAGDGYLIAEKPLDAKYHDYTKYW